MEKPDDLNFEVGQLAETKTFLKGFRGAWFRCKIKDINLKKNQIMPEYFDFPEEEITWTKIYELPHYDRKSKHIKRQLMVRPPYPVIHHKSEMPPVNLITEVCVVIDGVWKVGDLVDWLKDDCYWCARIIKVFSVDEVEVGLPMQPAGEGGVYKAFCKDLRPSLDWSPVEGWTLLAMKGQNPCSAQLIFPSPQHGMYNEREEVASPLNASSTSRISVISLAAPMEEEPVQSQQVKIDDVEKASSSGSISTMRVESISTMRVEESKKDDDTWEIVAPMEEEPVQSQQVKIKDAEKVSSSDSVSPTRVEDSKKDEDTWENVDHNNMIDLNIMHEETLEASILDLEEVANRIKWLKSILDNNQSKSGLWEFQG